MNITINGLDIGYGTDYQIESPLQGFESPGIRTSSENYSGRDGGIVTGQFYSGRQMTIPGFINEGTCANLADARRLLRESLPIGENLEMVITDFSGNDYFTSVRVVDYKSDIIAGKYTKFKIELYAGDPNFYDESSFTQVVIPRSQGGGFILPVVLPIYFAPGTQPTIVTNTGSVKVYPTITITGATTNPVVQNYDTAEKVELNVTTSPGDIITIDMYQRTITLNGGNILPLRSSDSSWFGIEPGVNRFTYNSDSGGDDAVVVMSWRNAVQGI